MSKLILGDCREVMGRFEDNTIDTVITDPPYGLKFMGKKWDYDIPAVEVFEEMLRVAKPGAFLLCFGGTRTFHRMACNIEDAGWMIRDCIVWLHGSGFPKSSNISKNIDKRRGAKREVVGPNRWAGRRTEGSGPDNGDNCYGQYGIPKGETKPFTDEAKLWNGWGTALKPAFEPIIVAMKPTEGTFVDNALNWDVAGLNIDGSRIGMSDKDFVQYKTKRKSFEGTIGNNVYEGNSLLSSKTKAKNKIETKGRWPANVILDEEAGRLLDEQSGISKSTGGKGTKSGLIDNPSIYGKFSGEDVGSNAGGLGDSGGASRFFYMAKASKAERNAGCERLEEKEDTEMTGRKKGSAGLLRVRADGSIGENPYAGKSAKAANYHPTVKPLKLIEYLCRLTKTPMGGIVLDPYVGSGTTAVACINTGRRFIGIENVKEYYAIAVSRVKHAYAARRKKS